jgi:hypothetical protein
MGQKDDGARNVGVVGCQGSWRDSQPGLPLAQAYTEGLLVAVGANESVMHASKLQNAVKRIKQLEAALGRKTLENDILKQAAEFAKSK